MSRVSQDALGICLGASSIGVVRLGPSEHGPVVLSAENRAHDGDARGALLAMLAAIPDWREIPVAVTGRKFRKLVRLPSLSEPEAVELAAAHVLNGGAPELTVLSAGGETFMAYRLDGRGRVREVLSGNKCASGTGEFLLQQLGRMGLGVADLAGLDHEAPPYKVSGRCSVFCKSDCTHALNKGAPKQDVVAGLGRMMAGKCLELTHKLPKDRLLVVGGCAVNPYLRRFLEREAWQVIIPVEAPWFEALGAALRAFTDRPQVPGQGDILLTGTGSFTLLPPLTQALSLVDFKEHPRGTASPGDEVLCGLDVGSTTTKGVLLRRSDLAIVAGEYLRTDGDPIGASRRVYASLSALAGAPVVVTGLGVTGSGRAIAALHSDATAAINEIVAHAAAAVHFDPLVDTIFEIGGQDAKYTQLSKGHPCDSAMNEACSAGTGSFLEESAKESLGVDTLSIGDLALQGASTPNFNDQCAAFIGSDIKIAVQEGVPLNDILAGLVSSVCMNYANRVKGNRPVGERVFMQGGVCYNRAVPVAMAALTGKRIVVPPEPGLMGALGVALEVDRRLRQGLLTEGRFDLVELAARQASHKTPFTCGGGGQGVPSAIDGNNRCDRGCTIARIEVAGKVHPFGGICNRFENLRQGKSPDTAALDVVRARQLRVFRDHAPPEPGKPTVGISRSYLVNTFYPLFSTFFRELGFTVLLPDRAEPSGMEKRCAALCFPAELSHGFAAGLLDAKPDVLFLPHIKAVPGAGDNALDDPSCTCVLLQGEPFYLKSAFSDLRAMGSKVLTPSLDFSCGLASAGKAFQNMAKGLGFSAAASRRAFQAALEAQRVCRSDLLDLGAQALTRLADTPDTPGVVLFGRAYSAFAAEANKGIPEKLASRGALVIPCDMLPVPPGPLDPRLNMYWGLGRAIMKAAKGVAVDPRLFGVYVTNFSCGPDSFLLSYFRDEMARKPSLTLELDSHTADAGLETRLEAFLDIAGNHLRLNRNPPPTSVHQADKPAAQAERNASGRAGVRTTSGEWVALDDPRLRVVIPSMNPYSSALAAASLARAGLRGAALPPADEEALKLGRGHSTCKECLPLQLTVGAALKYMRERPSGEVTAYFMPSAQGPCRFGQYQVFISRLFDRLDIQDAAVLSPCASNGYAGLSGPAHMGIWRGVVIGDVFEEMASTLRAGAVDPVVALAALETEFQTVAKAMAMPWKTLRAQLAGVATRLSRLPLRVPRHQLPSVSLVGEIYVRHDTISRQGLMERLARRGIVVRTSPVSEWVFYTDWMQNAGHSAPPTLGTRLRQWLKRRAFNQIRQALAPSGLFEPHAPKPEELIRAAQAFISPELTGEAILTVGAAFHEMLAPARGIIAIGPFGCMPTRLAEAVLAERFTTGELGRLYPDRVRNLPKALHGKLPFLAVETDGNPFPQLIEARLEAFCLQVLRLHEEL